MRVTGLQLINFRNHENTIIAPPGGLNVLYGDNAQGKTSVLEALFCLSVGRSHRTSRDRELIRWGERYARANVKIERRDGPLTIEIIIPEAGQRVIRVGGSPIKRVGDLIGRLNCVLFAPEDLSLIKEGPSERRRFLDMEISQLSPTYFDALSRYQKALIQRNALLKQARYNPKLTSTLSVWDEQLIEAGAVIIGRRAAFAARLAELARVNHLSLTGKVEPLIVEYVPDCEARDAFAAALKRSLSVDLVRGYTSAGPHRDDLSVRIGGKDVRTYGSQGQQRTAALALRLSEIDIMKEETGDPPILLLDDVMSELDPRRQAHLFSHLEGIQSFLTTAAPEAGLKAMPGVEAVWAVSGGTVRREG